jgi:hypothetical protein
LFCWRVFFLQQLCKPRAKTLHEEWMHHDALPQDNIHLGFALPPLRHHHHHHNPCFRQTKLPDSLQKKWLILIGYPETGKLRGFFLPTWREVMERS